MKWFTAFCLALPAISMASIRATDNNEKKRNRKLLKSATEQRRTSYSYSAPTWEPGSFSWGYYLRDKNGKRIRVSNGLTGRPIAYPGDTVVFINGKGSTMPFHMSATGGDVIKKADVSGYYYVSNSMEGSAADEEFAGGVFVIELDNNQNPVDYYPILQGTANNGGGGFTPWGSYVSCEQEPGHGACWQLDPSNSGMFVPTVPEKTALTGYSGGWSDFAWDDQDFPPKAYLTDNSAPDPPLAHGAVSRFTPDMQAMECYNMTTMADRWCALNSGTVDYLKLQPRARGSNCGIISWETSAAAASAGVYRMPTGIDVSDGILRFVGTEDRLFFEVDLHDMTYCQTSTLDGFPQQPERLLFNADTLYMTTDGRMPNGVYGMDGDGYYGVLMALDYKSEASGIDFSSDFMVMYVTFKDDAVWQFWRQDGLPFDWESAGIHYAPPTSTHIFYTEEILTSVIDGVTGDE